MKDGYAPDDLLCLHFYQDAVKELMDEQPQYGGQNVRQMVEELHVHHHGLVAHNECSIVSHETHHKHHLID